MGYEYILMKANVARETGDLNFAQMYEVIYVNHCEWIQDSMNYACERVIEENNLICLNSGNFFCWQDDLVTYAYDYLRSNGYVVNDMVLDSISSIFDDLYLGCD